MLIFIDIDNTITKTDGMNYSDAQPNYENIAKVNEMFNMGHTIVMWTARGTLSNRNYFKLTYNQLIDWGVNFHELRMGKPAFDLLIDDKAINAVNGNWMNLISTPC